MELRKPDDPPRPVQWAKVVDHTRCIGCHACSTACKAENAVPLSVHRTYVKYAETGLFPQVRRAFQVTRCNQCAEPPCVEACPTTAMHARRDGIVDFDKSICIGCKACMAACPYDAIFINPEDHSAEKCNLCAHRLDVGLEPACVVVCPTQAILVGDLNDPSSRVATTVSREAVAVRRPEKGTRPRLFYKGAHQATLDPLAARRPEGGLFLWSEQGDLPHQITPHPVRHHSSAAALLAYDVPHRAPWDWRVSLYTWTKGIAAGAYLLPALLVLAGGLDREGVLWAWAAPLLAAVFLAVTGLLLLADLEHPARFYLIFTRHQWRSWLVRGALFIAGYGLVLGLHLLASVLEAGRPRLALIAAGLPLSAMTAVYTAYLFAQARGRDLWQDPLLPPHFLAQAALAGAAALSLPAAALAPASLSVLLWITAAGSLAHLMFVASQAMFPHPTAHARLATRAMTVGRYASFFWAGAALVAIGLLAPWLGPPAAILALLGLLAYEHAHVQAAQSVPLA
jgi:Fe-S-cluster-containing dehydrogenase component/formate-dependent nitrite reductase membrane component NrfD